jgi:competence ComEA-like helix-hairpin-helix protein
MSEHRPVHREVNAPRSRLVATVLWVVTAALPLLSVGRGLQTPPRGQEQSPPPQSAPQPAAADAKAAEEEELARVGEETTDQLCRMCHPIENITRMRRTVREWADVITTMQGRGANGTEEQFQAIHKYLARYYGLVAVNTASAQDLSAVLGLTAKDAEAIVAYRKAHGKFADLAALSKVEGIDKAKIEEQPEAIRFQ